METCLNYSETRNCFTLLRGILGYCIGASRCLLHYLVCWTVNFLLSHFLKWNWRTNSHKLFNIHLSDAIGRGCNEKLWFAASITDKSFQTTFWRGRSACHRGSWVASCIIMVKQGSMDASHLKGLHAKVLECFDWCEISDTWLSNPIIYRYIVAVSFRGTRFFILNYIIILCFVMECHLVSSHTPFTCRLARAHIVNLRLIGSHSQALATKLNASSAVTIFAWWT